jgi:mannose-6-phosphate isomerase
MIGIGRLRQCAERAHGWLHDACFPLWAERGVTEGGYCEALDWQHDPLASDTARVRVQARQTYLFAVAKQLGWAPTRADELIGFGLETLETSCRTDLGLFARKIDLRTGRPVSQTADLYDTAFAILALAAAHGAGHQTDGLLAQTLAALDTHMTASLGGYMETLPAGEFRLQNPHMHLFEACLEAYAVTGESTHLDRAKRLYELCLSRFIDKETGTLGECFVRDDWSTPDGDAGAIVEPGHHFEWVWLLERYGRLSGTAMPREAKELYAFGFQTLDQTGKAIQSVTRQGIPHDGSARTWPQTEALKAHLTMMRAGDDQAAGRAVQSFDVLMETYLTDEGGWKDHFAADGTLRAKNVPASTGYHIVVAFLDLIETARA